MKVVIDIETDSLDNPAMRNPKYHAQYKWKENNLEKHFRGNAVYMARKRAKEKGIPFDITTKDLVWPETCPVLGLTLSRGKGGPWYNSPSLDRINPAKGYVKGNVRIISQRANSLKSNASLSELELVLDDARRH